MYLMYINIYVNVIYIYIYIFFLVLLFSFLLCPSTLYIACCSVISGPG